MINVDTEQFQYQLKRSTVAALTPETNQKNKNVTSNGIDSQCYWSIIMAFPNNGYEYQKELVLFTPQ